MAHAAAVLLALEMGNRSGFLKCFHVFSVDLRIVCGKLNVSIRNVLVGKLAKSL